MMDLLIYLVVWVFMMALAKLNFWVALIGASLFMILSLFSGPIYLGMEFSGYELVYDTLSFSLWELSVWLVILMVLASYSIFKEKTSYVFYIFMLNFMLFMLVLTFGVANYLGLYIFFEASLIPTLLVIVGWGYQTERLQAGIYFLFYTMVSSLPLLLMIIFIFFKTGTVSLMNSVFSFQSLVGWGWVHLLMFMAFTSAFLVKMPLFFVHLWLPKAHVEAPVAGSMILAGVLLKLGGYGLGRILFSSPYILLKMMNLLVSLGLASMLLVGFTCCRLNDMKALVAYSSVAHMGLVVSGLYIGGVLGFAGSLIMMVGHGLASSGLFMILNVYYERTGSRSFFLNKGMILILPTLSLLMFLLCASNMGAPPTINLLSELYLMGSLMGFDKFMMLLFPLGSFLGVVFTIFLFMYSQHGKMHFSIFGNWGLQMVEISSLLMHMVPLNFMVLKFDLFLLWL